MFQRLYDDEVLKDITFELDSGRQFKAHRCILRICEIEWFEVILKSSFKEASQTTIRVKDCSDNVFQLALWWAYGIKTSIATVEDYFEAADRFLAPSLVSHAYTIINNASEEYIRFILQLMEHPVLVPTVLDMIKFRDLRKVFSILKESPYFDIAERIILFVLENFTNTTKEVAKILDAWLIMPENELGRSPLEMREVTEYLLNKSRFAMTIFTRHNQQDLGVKLLIEKGYYTIAEINKMSLPNLTFLVIKSYPLRVAKLVPIDNLAPENPGTYPIYHREMNKVIKNYNRETMGSKGYFFVVEL